jgi:hypothetical protein
MGALAAAYLCLFAMVGCGSSPAVVPTSFGKYNSKDGTFACDTPDGWDIQGGGKQGPVWAKFTSGAAVIDIKADLAGSLLGDIHAKLGGADQAVLPQDEPVHRIHVADLDKATKEYDGYSELPPSPSICNSVLGPVRLSEFTAKSSFGTELHGYRVTILGQDKRVTVFCVAPETEWQSLKPVFDQVLASMERGT